MNPEPTAKTITAPIRPINAAMFITGLLIFGNLAIQSLSGFIERRGNYQSLGVLFIIVILPTAFLLRFSFLVPIKTIVDNQRLITYGLNGKREISLASIVNVTPVLLFPTALGENVMCLKIIDSAGAKVFIQLGTISKSNRALLSTPLVNACGAYIMQNDKVRKIWDRWLHPRSGATFLVTKLK